jgi:hypothetical protein
VQPVAENLPRLLCRTVSRVYQPGPGPSSRKSHRGRLQRRWPCHKKVITLPMYVRGEKWLTCMASSTLISDDWCVQPHTNWLLYLASWRMDHHHGLQLRFMRFVNAAPRCKRGTLPLCNYWLASRYSVIFAYTIIPTKTSGSLVRWPASTPDPIDLFGNTDSGMHVIID